MTCPLWSDPGLGRPRLLPLFVLVGLLPVFSLLRPRPATPSQLFWEGFEHLRSSVLQNLLPKRDFKQQLYCQVKLETLELQEKNRNIYFLVTP